MADAVFFDILPRFDWAASEAGQRKLIGQFDSAAKQISRTFGIEAGNAAKAATDKISADMRAMQESVATATTAATNDYRKMILAQGDLTASTLRVTEVTTKFGAESSQAALALSRREAATIKATQASEAHAASTIRETEAVAAATAAQAKHAEAMTAGATSTAAFGTAASTAGKVGLVAFTAAMYESGKMAGDFQQTQMRLVSSAGETAQGMQVVSDGILKLAGTVGTSSAELSKGMYIVESAGFHGADGIKVMTAAAQGAKAENADLTEVNNGLTTSLTDFHLPADQAATVMSKLVTAVGMSKANFEQFTGSLHSVEPAAAAAHIKLEDVYATLARMTQSGMSADQATENMRNAINSLAAPNAQQAAAMAQLGINADDVSRKLGERGLGGTMQYLANTIRSQLDPAGEISLSALNQNAQAAQNAADMIKQMSPAAAEAAQAFANGTLSRKEFTAAIKAANATDASQLQQFGALELKLDGFSKQYKNGRELTETYLNALKQVTGTVAAQSVALQTSGENADAYNKALQAVTATTTDADGKVKGFNETQQTLNAKMADAKAAFGAAVTQLGNDFIPTLTTVATTLAHVGEFLAKHKTILDALIITVGSLGAAWVITKAAMAIGSLVSSLATGFTAIGGFVMGLAGKYDALAVSAGAAAEAEAAAANPSTFAKGGAAGAAARGAAGAGAAALPFVGATWGFLGVASQVQNHDDPNSTSARLARARSGGRGGTGINSVDQQHSAAVPNDGSLPQSVGPHGAPGAAHRGGNEVPSPALADFPNGVDAAAAAAADARPDITAPGSLLPGGGGTGGSGAGSDATATGANINTSAPFTPIDVDPSHTPAGQTYDEWISGQKAMQSAQDKVTDTAINLAQAQARQNELLQKGHATQQEWNSAAEALSKAQRENQQAMQDATVAQNKAAMSTNKSSTGASSGMGETGSSILTGSLEFTPAGIAKYFTALLVNLAVGNPVGKSEAAKAGQTPGSPMYVNVVNANRAGGASSPYTQNSDGSLGYAGDAALLSNVPPGKYSNSNTDLVKGLGDCSSAVGDLVNIMDGRGSGPAAGQRLNTGNAATWLPQHGFLPGSMPGAFNVGYNPEHMQATLPGGTPFNYGSDAAAARGGIGGTGAFDPAFTSHYYRPVGGDGASLYSPYNTNPALTNPAAPGGGDGGGGPLPTGSILEQLQSQFLGGGGEGPIFKRSPPPGGVTNAIGAGAGLGGATNPFGPGGALSALDGTKSDLSTFGGMGMPAGTPGVQRPGGFNPYSVLSGSNAGTTGPGAASAAAARPSSVGQGGQFGQGQGGKGFSSSIGSTAASIAGPALDAIAPGAGMAAQKGGALLDRTIGYAGQLAGIAASGALETFLPGGFGDKLAGFDKSWLGKLAIGIGGVHKSDGASGGNTAGMSGPPKDPAKDAAKQAGAAAPAVPMPDQPHQGTGAPPGPGQGNAPLIGEMNVVHSGDADGAAIGRDINRYAGAMGR